MTRALLHLGILAASKATQSAHDTAKAAGCPLAARQLHMAGELIASALRLVIVDERVKEAS